MTARRLLAVVVIGALLAAMDWTAGDRTYHLGDYDLIPGDAHWSATGHQVVADEWLRQYRQRHDGQSSSVHPVPGV